ncbi:MAG TPA: PAS domain-containing protein, partial [Verrucomicrobiae bacterium]|nr:PAS domain-containing protein [Verrucomicrobiae bacterium]
AAPMPKGRKLRSVTQPPATLQALADRLILEHYAPSAVLVNEKGNILYVSGRTGKYLEPAAGKANWNIFVMGRDGLNIELGAAFHKALEQDEPVVLRGIKVGTNGGRQSVDVTIQRLNEPEPLRGMLVIVFTDVAAPLETEASSRAGKAGKNPARNARMEELERKYQQARLEARTVREEMQTAQEELRSTNEEQQSANEEMQSTNEELMTSKEEMQSLNEELQTVNSEMQVKMDELSRSNNNMKNLLNSTDIATLFLDNGLNVRRFTTQAAKIIKLIPGDIGRPLTDLASDLVYPELARDAHEVLRKLGFAEKPVSTRDGRWFTVRIMPYRTLDDRIDGVVITFTDITTAKTLEAKLREKHAVLEKRMARDTAESSKAGEFASFDAPAPKRNRAERKMRGSREQ